MNDPRELLKTCATLNWDSYGASPVTEEAVRVAERIQFVPTPKGGVQVELNGVEVEFGPNGKLVGVAWDAKG